MASAHTTKSRITGFIQDEFASQNEIITDDYPLIANGILNSIDLLRMVTYIETEFGIIFEPHEITADNLGSVNAMSAFIENKHYRANQ